ncbi:MAG: hypothetical protein IPM54_25075 [Polyangiaceae bacterium]|nr:hypothetical protein [Polyangiaceae bacterium]
MSFLEARVADMRPIRWLGELAEGIARALGTVQDREIDLLKAGVKMRVPDHCPDDALGKLAPTFRLPIFAGELAERLRGRMQEAFPTWEDAGLPEAIERSLGGYGVPTVEVFHWQQWHEPDDDWYSKFWVFISGLFGSLNWGEFNWGDATWGSTATLAEKRAVLGQVVFWKSPQSLPVSVIVGLGGGMIWGVHNWGDEVWGGETIQWPLSNLWGADWCAWGAFKWGNGRWITGEI